MKPKFKVGDRVLSVYTSACDWRLGTIIDVGDRTYPGYYAVRFDDFKYNDRSSKILDFHNRLEVNIKHIKIANTAITRKLFPNYEPDEKGKLVWRNNGKV